MIREDVYICVKPKQFRMKTVLFSMSILLLFSCGTKKISGDGAGQTIEMKTEKKLVATIGKSAMNNNPFRITNAVIEGNKLIVDVSYSGGCEEHFFELVGDEAISKSLPPQRTIRLVHTGKQDLCKAMIMRTLEFDIKNLAYQQKAGSEIILKLEGWDQQLMYTFE